MGVQACNSIAQIKSDPFTPQLGVNDIGHLHVERCHDLRRKFNQLRDNSPLAEVFRHLDADKAAANNERLAHSPLRDDGHDLIEIRKVA